MSDKVEEPCAVAVVSLDCLLDKILWLKLRAIGKGDKELFDLADGVEHYLKLLMDKNTIFER